MGRSLTSSACAEGLRLSSVHGAAVTGGRTECVFPVSVIEGDPVGFMAAVFYRRLQRVVFQAPAVSTSKWAWSKSPVQLGRSYLFHSTSDANRKEKGHRESPDTNEATTYAAQVTDYDENEVYSFDDYQERVSVPPKKKYATSPRFLLKNKKINLNLDHRETPRSQKPHKSSLYEALETYNTKQDPRAFQQHRPEYKSMCYNSKCLMETSTEEAEGILKRVTDGLTASEVSEFFEKLSYLPKVKLRSIKTNAQLDMLCNCSISNLRLYTNSEIVRILGALVRFEMYTSPSMLKKFEQEVCLRVWTLSTNELLIVADSFRYMSFSVPKFLDIMYSCMQLRCLDLSLPQLMQLIYVVGEGRQAPQELLEKIEAMVLKYITSLNIEEIGTVCLGFFKTGNGLSEHLMNRFGDILIENLEQMSNYALVSVLKMFRFTRVGHIKFFNQVGKDASKRVPEMTMQGIMHYVLTFASMHILNEDLMDAVALAIPDRVSYCRSKDLAKFLWSFGVLKYEPPNSDVFYSVFINQIHRNLEEFERFPEHFLTCLLGLAFCQQFPLHLIDFALNKNFVMQSNKLSMSELKKDLFTIAVTVEIECPQYTGNAISSEFRKEMTDMLVELSTLEIYTREEVIEAGMLLPIVLGGQQYVKEHMILPHTRSKDFEVHLDVNRKPVAINSVIEELDQTFIKYRHVKISDDLISKLTNASSKNSDVVNPNIVEDLSMNCPEEKNEDPPSQSEVTKLAIQVTNRNQYRYGSKQLLGLHALKRRQLRKLGYVVVEVPFWEWFPLVNCTRSEKLAYLHHKVFSSVQVK
ncbi:FAST kinase domain-containing protein 5, mitochondrial [Rana temporaria]|uniref:FAST kinase domain-containing protein 5, mitochondrial n=1 Tax=Rana temporaria TaxID=8407 RepID=UPI001AAD03FB|nr:FAST kinase domain-containing protein 5, mitochondrial [Rana temporaria]